MTGRVIVVSASPGEIRIACLEGARLYSIDYIRTAHPSRVGSVYLGRVKALNTGLQAAFVDIGLGQDGFLAVDDVRPWDQRGSASKISDHLKEGDAITVQVLRDGMDGKGCKLTARCTLAGMGVIFKPGQPGVQLSSRINGKERRQNLSDGFSGICPEGDGFIVRTVASSIALSDVQSEAARLINEWQSIQHSAGTSKAPALLGHRPHPVVQVLHQQASGGIAAIHVDSADLYALLKQQLPTGTLEAQAEIFLHRGKQPVFETYLVEEQIEAALAPAVGLPSGGSIHIQQTRALTAIDVDTGAAQASTREQGNTTTNLEAAMEIGRQIFLRGLSGQLVIDFVPMTRKTNRERVLETLKKHLSEVSGKPRIHGFTQLGLVEISRRREGLSLSEILCDLHPGPQKSAVTLAYEAIRQVLHEAQIQAAAGFSLRANPSIIAALNNQVNSALKEAETVLGLKVNLKSDGSLALGDIQVMRR